MARKSPEELQTKQDVCRAECLVALAQGLTRQASAQALRYRAAAQGLSVHAAALAVLSTEPTDELMVSRSSQPAQSTSHRHLYALRTMAAENATATTSEVAFTLQRG